MNEHKEVLAMGEFETKMLLHYFETFLKSVDAIKEEIIAIRESLECIEEAYCEVEE